MQTEATVVSYAFTCALAIVLVYLAYKGPNRLYKRELEIVSATLRKSVRESVRHDKTNVESWLLIVKLVRSIPTSNADFTISYLITRLENELLYRRNESSVKNYRDLLSCTLRRIHDLRYAFEIDISRNPDISRIAIPKSIVIKSIRKAIRESS